MPREFSTADEKLSRWMLDVCGVCGYRYPNHWPGCSETDFDGRSTMVEVMPVSEHEEIVASLNQSEPGSAYFTSPAMKRLADEHERLERAADELARAATLWLSETGPGMRVNTAKGRGETRRALERLRAAVNPQEDE